MYLNVIFEVQQQLRAARRSMQRTADALPGILEERKLLLCMETSESGDRLGWDPATNGTYRGVFPLLRSEVLRSSPELRTFGLGSPCLMLPESVLLQYVSVVWKEPLHQVCATWITALSPACSKTPRSMFAHL